jgi:heme/copper-type cytochrome/quinol oxidase subunit 3
MDTLATAAPAIRNKPFSFTNGKLAMWLFLASDAMGFMGLIGAYMVLRITSSNWMHPALDPEFGINLTAFMTFVLILSSVTMVTALDRIQKGNQKGLLIWLGATIAGGLVFVGLQVYEWSLFIHHIGDLAAVYEADLVSAAKEAGQTVVAGNQAFEAPFTNYQATFFTLTGFHGLHVSIGVIYLSCIWWRAYQGAYSAASNSPVELVGLYWHFVDLVWIVLFTIIYLLPDSVPG